VVSLVKEILRQVDISTLPDEKEFLQAVLTEAKQLIEDKSSIRYKLIEGTPSIVLFKSIH